MIGSLALLLAAIPAIRTTVPIDNAIKGQPIISCGTRTVSIAIETANQFFGNVYVKLNPRGLVVDTTIVLMFHPIFMTQVDRAYHVQCNYMESNEQVTQSLDVSTQAPTELPRSAAAAGNRKPPTCKYEVLSKDKHGPPIVFATIGETVYHRWTCEADDNLQYCMTVHSCTADDGQGVGQQLIDERG
ncbi:unnamed protein product [Cylicocyclus nassatus]|uniref:ZP domain-containing protein n=1 Tax=Cylicocyclus nassatus TaxID=53992 RepID=A0AA36GCZ1_CYLNA|nr:unnamed protein product [Cylicocyclus nassatus]